MSVATGLPHEYFARQDDEIVATYLDILKQAHGKRSSRPAETPNPGERVRGRQMSG